MTVIGGQPGLWRMAELTINGDVFDVEVEGQATKPALVLSNALGTVLTMWEPQMAALLRHFRVIRYDSRGHGNSTEAGAPYSLGRLGRDVLAILDAFEIERAHFVGLSMGGAVGQWLLVNAPHRFERAVLANTAPRLGSPAVWNARIRTVLAGDMDANADSAIERWFSDDFRRTNPEAVGTIEECLRKASPSGYAASCAALRDMDLRQAIQGVRHPVLVITGTDDPVTSADDVKAMTSALPNVRHIALKAKHLSSIEAADAFSDAIVTFLTSRAPARAARTASAPARPTARLVGSARRVGSRVTARPPATKSKTAVEPAPAKTARAANSASAKQSSVASKAVSPGRGRSAKASTRTQPTRTQARKPVNSPTAPSRDTARKGSARSSMGRQQVAAAKAKASSAVPGKVAQKAAASAVKQAASKSTGRGAATAATAAPSRRPTPVTSARSSKTAVQKKPASDATATRQAQKRNPPAKLPGSRRKTPPRPRRPKGRGKS